MRDASHIRYCSVVLTELAGLEYGSVVELGGLWLVNGKIQQAAEVQRSAHMGRAGDLTGPWGTADIGAPGY